MRMLHGVSETERVRITLPPPSSYTLIQPPPPHANQKTEMWAKVRRFLEHLFAVPQLRVGEDFAQTKNGDVHEPQAPCLQPFSPHSTYTVVTKITGSFRSGSGDINFAAKNENVREIGLGHHTELWCTKKNKNKKRKNS